MKKFILISSIILALFAPLNAFAEEDSGGSGGSKTFDACKHVKTQGTAVCAGSETKAEDVVKNIISILFWIIGILAVIVIIYAGITFITAAGNPSKVAQAKTMIIYAVIGLVVAILAYTIVNFIVGASSGKGVNGGGSSSKSSSSSNESSNSEELNSSDETSKHSTKPDNSSSSNTVKSQSGKKNGENSSGRNSSSSNNLDNNWNDR